MIWMFWRALVGAAVVGGLVGLEGAALVGGASVTTDDLPGEPTEVLEEHPAANSKGTTAATSKALFRDIAAS
jgi:hypothetical protein